MKSNERGLVFAMSEAPIGVFDSGVGGLSVLREMRSALPNEDLLYVADSGHAPYGDRSGEFISARAEAIVRFFLAERVKSIVVACNTATAIAIQSLRLRFPLVIVAIEPAVKPAALLSCSGIIGVLATHQTLASESFARLMALHGQDVEILPQPCPGLVELVEGGELQSSRTVSLLTRYLGPLLQRGADTIVLGCTHYPFLLPAITAITGPKVSVLDPAPAVARELQRRLKAGNLLSSREVAGSERFWTSGVPGHVQSVVRQLWGGEVRVQALPQE